jgi:hypothetical protein
VAVVSSGGAWHDSSGSGGREVMLDSTSCSVVISEGSTSTSEEHSGNGGKAAKLDPTSCSVDVAENSTSASGEYSGSGGAGAVPDPTPDPTSCPVIMAEDSTVPLQVYDMGQRHLAKIYILTHLHPLLIH